MKKPEKLKMIEGVTHNRFISGYNQACKDWEEWVIGRLIAIYATWKYRNRGEGKFIELEEIVKLIDEVRDE